MGFISTTLTILAQLNLALIDLIVFDIIISLLFFVDDKGKIKYRFDTFSGLSQYIKSEVYVFGLIIASIIYFFLSNSLQDWATQKLVDTLGWMLIVSFFILLSFAVFYICVFILKRKIDFRLVLISIISLILSIPLFITLLLIKYSQ